MMRDMFGFRLVLATLIYTAACGVLTTNPACGDEAKLKDEFLKLCDKRTQALEDRASGRYSVEQARKDQAFGCFSAYVVRALGVAFDLEGKEEYLHACKGWADRMIECQNRMIPKGAYYMDYGRTPGEDKGNWYVADASCIAMGVLATAVRCEDPAEKKKYMDSVDSFYRLVVENWVRPSGGVANGHWPKSDKEFWCATGSFGSLAFCLYKETGDPKYLKIGQGTIDWLNRQNLLNVASDFYPGDGIKPAVVMYCLEAYSAGLPHLEMTGGRRKAALIQLANNHKWMLASFDNNKDSDYLPQWGSKRGGFPYLLYTQAKRIPNGDILVAAADRELLQVSRILEKTPPVGQLAAFALMSYAENVSPGGIYRTSKEK